MEFIKGDWIANRIKGRTINQILERTTQFQAFRGQELRKRLFKVLTPMRLNFKFSVLSHSVYDSYSRESGKTGLTWACAHPLSSGSWQHFILRIVPRLWHGGGVVLQRKTFVKRRGKGCWTGRTSTCPLIIIAHTYRGLTV